jgi:PAS domain S-box-containing protein
MSRVATERERTFDAGEIIVSKTDLRGRIVYANDVFLRVSGYDEGEVLGTPHSFVRHPDMPRGVFRLAWDTIRAGGEIFAYVKNLTKSGDYYWVFAHMTPTFDDAGTVTGYHSSRRVPRREALVDVQRIYAEMRAAESAVSDAKSKADASVQLLGDILAKRGVTYAELMFELELAPEAA